MKIDRIARLFSQSAQNEPLRANQQNEIRSKQASSENSEAVRLARDFGGADASRTERIAQLKQQVESGEYRPERREVALAVYKELML